MSLRCCMADTGARTNLPKQIDKFFTTSTCVGLSSRSKFIAVPKPWHLAHSVVYRTSIQKFCCFDSQIGKCLCNKRCLPQISRTNGFQNGWMLTVTSSNTKSWCGNRALPLYIWSTEGGLSSDTYPWPLRFTAYVNRGFLDYLSSYYQLTYRHRAVTHTYPSQGSLL